MIFKRKQKEFKMPTYQDVNGIRIFDEDYKVLRARWVGERIDCGTIAVFKMKCKYLYVKAYALTPKANIELNNYYYTSVDRTKYRKMSGISNVTSLGAILYNTGEVIDSD